MYHDEECYGYGYHKKCHPVPREECQEVPVKVPVKVPLEVKKKIYIACSARYYIIFARNVTIFPRPIVTRSRYKFPMKNVTPFPTKNA